MNGFKTNKPQAVNALLKEAENRNLSLLQARLSQDTAREQIRQAQDGHLPTLNLSASTGVSNTRYNGSKTNTPLAYNDSDNGQNQIGLNFSLPLYQGGAVTSQVKQAQYNFVGASEQLESAHRSVVQTVRSSFNNVNASISSINAYKQAVVSAQSSWMPWKLATRWVRVLSLTSSTPPLRCITLSSSSRMRATTT